jgi:hypothetical protein
VAAKDDADGIIYDQSTRVLMKGSESRTEIKIPARKKRHKGGGSHILKSFGKVSARLRRSF